MLAGGTRPPPDSEAAARLLRAVPGAVTAAYQDRRFRQTAVQYLAACAGIRQFIDLGCGHPAPGTVHQTARTIAPGARVVHVDCDASVITAVKAVTAGDQSARAISGDVHQPRRLLSDPALLALIDLAEPVAIVLTAVLHFVTDDDDPVGIVTALVQALAPGSYLVLSHATADYLTQEVTSEVREVYASAGAWFAPRSYAQVTGLLDGLEVTQPGVVNGAAWRPGYLAAEPRPALFYAGLGRKR